MSIRFLGDFLGDLDLGDRGTLVGMSSMLSFVFTLSESSESPIEPQLRWGALQGLVNVETVRAGWGD